MIEHLEPTDYSVAVKQNRKPRNSWRWEINRPGKSTPVKQSADHFETMAEATRAGKEALHADYQHQSWSMIAGISSGSGMTIEPSKMLSTYVAAKR
jgi:hypothetical protein